MSERLETISDLIVRLSGIQRDHGDLPVLVDGYEDDFDAPRAVTTVEVYDKGADRKDKSWWNGRYEDAQYADEPVARFMAVVIQR